MAQNNTAVKVGETIEEKLARYERENAEMKAQLAAVPAPGKFGLSITEARAPGARGENDKGSKGGTLAVSLGNQHVYPSKAMVMAIIEHADEIKAFMQEHASQITR